MSTDACNAVVPVRAPAKLLEALDAEVKAQRQRKPGQRITRADVVRSLLWEGLDRAQHDRAGEAA